MKELIVSNVAVATILEENENQKHPMSILRKNYTLH